MKNIFMSQILTLALSLLLSQQAYAKFTYEGHLTNANDYPISGPIWVRVSILSPTTSCIIFQETHPVTADLKGFFSIQVGGGAATAGLSIFDSVFKNDVSITGIGSCTYAPGLGDSRLMQIEVNTDGGPTYDNLGMIALGKAPQATHADTVGGFDATRLFRVATGVTAPAELNSADVTKFISLIAGTSTQYVQAGGSNLSSADITTALGFTPMPAGTQILQTLGTNSIAPAYSFSGDTSTGIFHPAVNILGFAVGGVEGMRLAKNPSGDATLMVKGHLGSSGTAMTSAALSGCGTGASIIGNDTRGRVTLGSGATMDSCSITFVAAFESAPFCVVSWAGSLPGPVGATATTTALTVHFPATPATGYAINYLCLQ